MKLRLPVALGRDPASDDTQVRSTAGYAPPEALTRNGNTSREKLWSIVLAGGEGVRLRPLVRQFCGDERPKQFATIIGSKSLLRHTLDRVALKIPSERTVIVTCRSHSNYMEQEFDGVPPQHVLVQPEDRGTAAGILFPAQWIHTLDPEALVAVFPSDHFILEGHAFMEHVLDVAAFVGREPARLVLLGAQAEAADTEYGWIEPGAPVGHVGAHTIFRVRRFWEKPLPDGARSCLATGCLWNTFIFVSKVSTLVDAGRALLPEVSASMARVVHSLNTGGDRAIEQEYRLTAKADFSRAILEPCPPMLAVSTPPQMTWSDLGTPDRVIRTLQLMTDSRRSARNIAQSSGRER